MGTIRDKIHNPTTCMRCLEEKDASDIDRSMWCDACKARARVRATFWGWVSGSVLAVVLAIWIWIVIQPSDLVIGGWIATVIAALGITGRIAREIAYGVIRYKNSPGVEVVPSDPATH